MSQEKKEFRSRVRGLISGFDSDYMNFSDGGITERLLSLPEYAAATRVFTYWSEGRECDTHAMMEAALAAGKTIAMPVVFGGGEMAFAEYRGGVRVGPFGIPEPREDGNVVEPAEGDLMVVPALCCAKDGYRLGRGGGYYDRYLAKNAAFSVCLCRERLLMEKVPREWNDLPVSAVITESRIIRM